MKQLFRQILGHMLDQYVTVLTILALVSSVTYLVLIYDLKDQEGNTALVRLAAQQGQIVHQINFLTSQLVHTEGIDGIRDIRGEIIKKVTQFKDTHVSLKQGDRFVREGMKLVHIAGTLSPDLRTLYFEKPTQLNRLVRKYLSSVRGVLRMNHEGLNQNRQALERLHTEISVPLVAGLDQAVALYHKESEYMLSQTQNLQSFMFAVTLISLVVVETFLLRPLVLKLKESMLRVQEEKEFTDNVINTAQALIIGLDPSGKIVLFNQHAQENTGWQEEEVKGGEFFERFIPADDRERLQNLYNDMIEGTVEFAGEMGTRLMIRSGEQVNIVWHTTVVKDPQSNQPALFLATGLDITGRKLAEQNLQNAHKELEQLSARLQEEINLAATLQNAILPDPKIDLPGIVGEASLLTSSEVGGDYYDYYKIGGYRSVLLVGDVSGHGVAAGTMVSAAKAGVYPLIHEGVSSPGEILQSLNKTMLATAQQSLLMTMACLSLDARNGKLVFANAGHVLPYLWRRQNRQWEMLEASGLPLGKSSEVDYIGSSVEIQLEVGDRLFLFTDGVVEEESPVGEPFGYDRLERVLDEFGEAEPELLRDKVMAALHLHCGGAAFTDDVTIVVVNHSDRVVQAVSEESDASDIVRLSESFYRHGEHPVPRVSRQYVVFTGLDAH
jgi:phosphoserine phosphatase RsbU/P